MIDNILVCGFGYKDVAGSVTNCPFYRRWYSMLSRCYNENTQRRQPAYTGCEVTPEWASFASFKAWMAAQPWEGNQLDKDLLFPGNKVYSPDRCCFLSHTVNSFLTDSAATRSIWPVGVTKPSNKNRFCAHCSNPFAAPHTKKRELLGVFNTPEEAHQAWRAKKHEHACRLADMQTDQRVANALRTRFSEEQNHG